MEMTEYHKAKGQIQVSSTISMSNAYRHARAYTPCMEIYIILCYVMLYYIHMFSHQISYKRLYG